MAKTNQLKRTTALFMALVLSALCFTLMLHIPFVQAVGEEETKKIEDYTLSGKTIGVQIGTTAERKMRAYEESSRSTIERYYALSDAVQALTEKKVDCFLTDEAAAQSLMEGNQGLSVYEKPFSTEEYAFAVQKDNKEWQETLNKTLKKLTDNGTLESIVKNYIGPDSEKGRNPYQKQDTERTDSLTLAVINTDQKPYCYSEGGRVVGLDIDVMQAVCDELGYELYVQNMALEDTAYALSAAADMLDMGMASVAAGLPVNDNSKKSVSFTSAYTTSVQSIVLYEEPAPEESSEPAAENADEQYNFKDKTIGVQLGTTGDIYATDYEKDGTAKIERFNKAADAIQALKQKKLDCVILDEQPAKEFVSRNKDIRILPKKFTQEDYALCIKKGNKDLLDKVNAALKKLKEDGTIQKIITNYIGTDEEKGTMPYEKKDVERKGKLIVATNAEFPPYEYVDDGKITGIDMDIMQAICDELGMDMSIENMKFDSIIASVNAGKADIGAAGMTVTEDRLKNIDFSESYTTSKQVIIVYNETSDEIKGVSDLADTTIGVQLGTVGDVYATEYETDGYAKVERYSKAADAIQALKQKKVDCVILDEQPAKEFVKRNNDIKIVEEELASEEYALCVKKGNKELLDKVNTALEKLKADGTIRRIINNYIGTDEQIGTMPYEKKDVARTGTLIVATNAEFPPYEYISNGNITGIDMDIMQAICDELGMELKIENMKFDSIIAAVNAGKADVGAAGMTVTEDRKKNIDFSDSYTVSRQVLIIYDQQGAAGSLSFGEKLHQNFIEQDRWRYLADGLGTTMLITVLSILVGLFLGTLIAVVRTVHDQNGKLVILNFICKAYLTIIRGTPAVLQLLIIYYGIFNAVNVSKVLVAVIAFGLNSAAYVAEVIRSGINAVDKGQFEAGRCLGLSYKQTMSHIIMPQALKNMLPALLNEFISLLKETAICGYIALQDLTMGGDIIRSQTFDAFLPLIAVAIIYLIIVMILSRIVAVLERRMKKNESK